VPSDLNRDGVTNDEEVASNYYRFSKEPLPAYDDRFDINFDGVVDGVDEAIYWEHLGTIDKSWHAGDFRGEGRLSFTARELGGTAPGVSPALPQTGFTAAGSLDIDNRFGYAGYIWDQHLGIYHVRHRAYDPFAGRWLQPDPLALMGPELLLALTSRDGSNLYAYVGNNPNGFVDPYGLWEVVDSPGMKGGRWGTYHNFYRTEREYLFGFIPTWHHSTEFSHSDFTLAGEETSELGTSAYSRRVGVELANASSETQGVVYAAGAAGEVVIRVAFEPVDTAFTVVEIAHNPTNPWSYAGLLPVVPGVVGKAARLNDEAADLLRAATTGPASGRGAAGEAFVDKMFQQDGWTSLPTKYNKSNHGFDGVYVKYAKNGDIEEVLIVEVKTGSGVSNTTKAGKQMSNDWTKEKIKQMMNSGGDAATTAQFIVTNYASVQRAKVRIGTDGTIKTNHVDSKGNVVRTGGTKVNNGGANPCQTP
jgi:RHS repeat-associated protein